MGIQEAFEALEEAKQLWITDCLESGDPVPEPATEEALPSGKWVQRVARTLHQKLVSLAKRENVSLNQFVASVLAEAVGVRRADHTDYFVNLRSVPIELTYQWSNRLGPRGMTSLSAKRTAGTNIDQGTIILQPPYEEVGANG